MINVLTEINKRENEEQRRNVKQKTGCKRETTKKYTTQKKRIKIKKNKQLKNMPPKPSSMLCNERKYGLCERDSGRIGKMDGVPKILNQNEEQDEQI